MLQRPLQKSLKLTGRQKEAARLICLGLTNKEIAFTMGISPRTAEDHRRKVFEKLRITGSATAKVLKLVKLYETK